MDDLANVLDGMHLSDGSDDSGASEGAQGDGGRVAPPARPSHASSAVCTA